MRQATATNRTVPTAGGADPAIAAPGRSRSLPPRGTAAVELGDCAPALPQRDRGRDRREGSRAFRASSASVWSVSPCIGGVMRVWVAYEGERGFGGVDAVVVAADFVAGLAGTWWHRC